HPAETVRAIGQREILKIFRHVAREGRRQVVTQREPLLVIVLEREHPLVRPVLVRQELAERIGVFDRRSLYRVKAIALEHGPDRLNHVPGRGDFGRSTVGKATRQAGFEFSWLVRFIGHRWSTYQTRAFQQRCKLSWPGLSPEVGYSRLPGHNIAQLALARVVCAIPVFTSKVDVDARHKAGHDGE